MVTNFSNTAVDTTLNGAITNVATSLVVVSATGYPAVPFNIQIENEVIRVGAKSGTTFSTLTRGYDGTTGVSHVDGSAVSHVVIAEDVGPRVQAWTPTLFNMTLGDGTVEARYQVIGQVCWFFFSFTLGSTSAMSGGPAISLPVLASNAVAYTAWTRNSIGIANIWDDSTSNPIAAVCSLGSNSILEFRYLEVVSSLVKKTTLGATMPITWAVNDVLMASGSYEVA